MHTARCQASWSAVNDAKNRGEACTRSFGQGEPGHPELWTQLIHIPGVLACDLTTY
jgi:hypothetical protein